jgi:hypothetical protein
LFAKSHKIHGSDPEAISKGKMRPRLEFDWTDVKQQLTSQFGLSEAHVNKAATLTKDELSKGYEMMHLCRSFENACNQAYMQGQIRGFMHLGTLVSSVCQHFIY